MIFDVRPTADGGFTATQRHTTPAVYLDFCALRAIAEKPSSATRFAQAMLATSATLLVSAFTLYEFAALSDIRHATAVDVLLRQIFRHMYFIQAEPFTVVAREDAEINGIAMNAPHADAEMFKQTLITVSQQQGNFELASIFSARSSEARSVLDDFKQSVREAFENLQTRVHDSHALRSIANNAFLNIGDRKAATSALLAALIKPLHDDRLPTENDTVDLMHTIVPSSYADIVVLDAKWATAITQATARMRKAGYGAPVAKAFSMRGAGIENFLCALETWPTAASNNDKGIST